MSKNKSNKNLKVENTKQFLDFKKITFSSWLLVFSSFCLLIFLIWQAFLPFKAEIKFKSSALFISRAKWQTSKITQYPKAEQEQVKEYVLNLYRYAITDLQKAVAYAPWEVKYYVELGKAYQRYFEAIEDPAQKLAALKNAETMYQQASKLDPKNPWNYERLGSVYHSYYELVSLEQKKPFLKLAKDYFYKAAQAGPFNPLFQLNYAYFLQTNNFSDEAIQYYEKTVSYDGRILEARYNLAAIYTKTGALDKSLAQYLAIQKTDPDYRNINFYIGYIYYAQKKYEQAATYFRTGLQNHPNNTKIFHNYLLSLYHLGKWTELIKLHEQRLNNTSYYKAYITQYLDALIKADKKQKAFKVARTAIVKHPQLKKNINKLLGL
ncbi:tetratricopeptide repeat protein [bacterium]|nr:tetratricopeptide repeat protein [bacterium]